MDQVSQPVDDVGSLLKRERLRRGLSLEMVQKQIRIPRKYIEALEQNRTSDFPAFVYLQGFLRSYCEFLGLDFELLWSKLLAKIQPAPAPEPTQEPAAPLEKEKKEKQRSVEKLSLSSLGFHWEFFLLLPVVILLFWKFNPGKDKKTVKEKEAESSSFSDLSVPAKEFSLQVKFMEPSWIRLAIDGKLSFEGKVPGGVSQEWKGKESAVLRTTTPESIQVMLDGKSLSLDQLSRSPSGDFVLFSGRK